MKIIKLFALILTVLSSHLHAEVPESELDFTDMRRAYEDALAVSKDTNNSKSCTFINHTRRERNQIFDQAVLKLRGVNNWANIMKIPGQEFSLYNSAAKKVNRSATLGDFIKIELPADPSFRSYWVKVESVTLSKLSKSVVFSIVVRPSANPLLKRKNKKITDHFFTNAATNTFSIKLQGNKLESSVNGRNEIANTTQVPSWADGAANYSIAIMGWGVDIEGVGAVGFQPLVWSKLNSQLAKCDLVY